MKDLITVIKFTMKDMAKRKSFIISTIIILVLIVIGFNVRANSKVRTKAKTESVEISYYSII